MRLKKFFALVLLVAVVDTAKIFGQVIPPDRTISWVPGATVGVLGGIPTNRTSIIDVTQPPYNADNTGKTSAVSAILTAINAAAITGQVVYCPAGTYDITAGITIQVNNITLRGAGSNTVFVGSIAVGSDPVGSYPFGYGLSIFNGATKGSTNVTFVSTADPIGGLSVSVGDSFEISGTITGNGMWQYISSNGGEQREQQINALRQPVLITSVSGNSCTFTPPLVWDFTNSPLALPLSYIGLASQQMRSGIGLENFTLTTTSGSLNSTPSFMLKFSMLHDSWVTGCNFYNGQNYSVYFEDCVDCSFSHNNVRFARSSGSNHAGLLAGDDSGCLIEDNILADGLEPGIEWNDAFCGNAVFGNYLTNNVVDIDMHNTHPVMDLWEENVSGGFELDGYFGSCSHQTVFRNQFYNGVLFKRFSTYISAVGNVLGNPNSPFIYCPSNSNYGTQAIFEIGYPNIGNPSFTAVSGPVPYNYPGNSLMGALGENVTNGAFLITKTQVNTNVITGIFTNIPTDSPSVEGLYPIVGQDPVNTNWYWYIGSPVANGVTSSKVTLSANTTVSNSWRVFITDQSAYQWLQTSNVLTDIITGNAVCTNQSSYTTVWDSNGVQSLPWSYLYTNNIAPSYWGSSRWPAIDPANNPPMVPIPAQYRYLGLTAASTNVSLSFSANPLVLASGGPTTLIWSAANATNVTIVGLGSVDASSGSTNVVPAPATRTTYTAIASGLSGSETNSVTVIVKPLPPSNLHTNQ